MSEDEFNGLLAKAHAARSAPDPQAIQEALNALSGGSGAGNAPALSTATTAPANGWSINGLNVESGLLLQTPLVHMTNTYSGECLAGFHEWGATGRCVRCNTHTSQQIVRVSSDYGEQCADTDGLAVVRATADVAELSTRVAELETRIARKEAANEALVQRVFAADAKHEATMADMRSLQRQAENWQAECKRLSALLIETQEQLAKRMAMPARALRFGGVR